MPATLAKGTVVSVETAEGSGIYSPIPLQTNVSGPQLTSTEHNVSSHDTAGLVMEFIGGMIDPGSLNWQIWEDVTNALHRQLDADKLSLLQRNYKKTWPNGYYRILRAYIKDYNPTHGVDAPHTASIQARCTAAPGAITAP
jgi:hypothetical protein